MSILDARQIVKVKSPADLRRKQLAVLRHTGGVEQIVTTPVLVRIEQSRWLFDCVCGSGVAVHPDWPEARCLGEMCGRVYVNVHLQSDWPDVVTALEQIPHPRNRNWYPGEHAQDVGRASAAELWERHAAYLKVAAEKETP